MNGLGFAVEEWGGCWAAVDGATGVKLMAGLSTRGEARIWLLEHGFAVLPD